MRRSDRAVKQEETPMSTSAARREELLQGVALFEGVGPESRAAIAALATEVEFPAGRPIARQGEIGSGFFLILAGAVHVVRDGEVLAHLGAGDFFGELSVLDQKPRLASVVTDEPTSCLAISTWDFEKLLKEEPGLALAVLRVVAGRLREVSVDHRH
jgi:CRP/FNR family cyclic AMP-dependent transcriptional regulator